MSDRSVENVLNHLCSMPTIAHAMVTKNQLRQVLTVTGGDVLAQGRLYDVVSEHRGAGMYTIRLKRRESA